MGEVFRCPACGREDFIISKNSYAPSVIDNQEHYEIICKSCGRGIVMIIDENFNRKIVKNVLVNFIDDKHPLNLINN